MGKLWDHVLPTDAVIMNGIDLDRFAFHPEPDALEYLVWYERIVPEKGLHLALAAARQVGLPLKIAGPILNEVYAASRLPHIWVKALSILAIWRTESSPNSSAMQALLCVHRYGTNHMDWWSPRRSPAGCRLSAF